MSTFVQCVKADVLSTNPGHLAKKKKLNKKQVLKI